VVHDPRLREAVLAGQERALAQARAVDPRTRLREVLAPVLD
jgi:hypothetical protein